MDIQMKTKTYSCIKSWLAITLCLAFLNGYSAGRQLPTDLQDKLVKLQADFEKEAAKADELQKRSQTDLKAINTIREIAAPKQASASDISGTNLLMGLDGMTIFLQTFSVEAGLNRDSFRILEGVMNSILAGERYKKLDEALQELETTQSKRDNAMRVMPQHFDQVVGVLQLARQGSHDSTVQSAFEVLDALIAAQRLVNGVLVDQYEEGIKPGTQALREIVDKLAKGGG
jgi:hypothetical protein